VKIKLFLVPIVEILKSKGCLKPKFTTRLFDKILHLHWTKPISLSFGN